jgi:hypothetical protein
MNTVILSRRNVLTLLYRSLIGKETPLHIPDGYNIYVEPDEVHYARRQPGPRPAEEEDFIKIMERTARVYAGQPVKPRIPGGIYNCGLRR